MLIPADPDIDLLSGWLLLPAAGVRKKPTTTTKKKKKEEEESSEEDEELEKRKVSELNEAVFYRSTEW